MTSRSPHGLPYKVERVKGKGRVLVAIRNALPGEELFFEEALLSFSGTQHFPKNIEDILAKCSLGKNLYRTFLEYQKLSLEKKRLMLTLFGAGDDSAEFNVTKMCKDLANDLAKLLKWSKETKEIFVKVTVVSCLNGFGVGDDWDIFEHSTLMSHSCKPNCNKFGIGTFSIVHAIVPISKGDELTLTYNRIRDWQSICERRAIYEYNKHFICQCERCSVLGDDTRQFNCFNKQCPGRHFTCQPVMTDAPYLLPCVVCQTSPPQRHQEDMFHLEETLQSFGKQMRTSFVPTHANKGNRDIAGASALLKRLMARPACHYHVLADDVLFGKVTLLMYLGRHLEAIYAVLEYGRLHDNLLRTMSPNERSKQAFGQIGLWLKTLNHRVAFDLARSCVQRAMRIHLNMFGRMDIQTRNSSLDQCLLDLMRLSKCQGGEEERTKTTCCIFCGESPSLAAISLSPCGRCKKAFYCSKECQSLHSAVHGAYCLK